MDFLQRIGLFILFIGLTIVTIGLYPLFFVVTRAEENNRLLREIVKNQDTKSD